MLASASRPVIIGVLLVLIFLTGFGLSRRGRPYGALLMTAHKLMGVAALGLLGAAVYRSHRAEGLGPAAWALATVAALSFVVAIASGALLSTDRPALAPVSTAHRVAPYLAALATAATLYLVAART